MIPQPTLSEARPRIDASDFQQLVKLARQNTIIANYAQSEIMRNRRIHFLDDFNNYAGIVFTHYRKFRHQVFLVTR